MADDEVITVPLNFCAPFPKGAFLIRLPFGLPPLISNDLWGLTGLINVLLAAFSPFLNVIGCAFKVIGLFKAIGTLNPISIAQALAGLAECFGLIIPGYALIVPTAIIQFIQFIFDLLVFTVGLLQYILAQIALIEQAISANGSLPIDEQACSTQHIGDALADMTTKFNGIQSIIVIINTLVAVFSALIAPVAPQMVANTPMIDTSSMVAALNSGVLADFFTACNEVISILNELIAVLQLIPIIPPSPPPTPPPA